MTREKVEQLIDYSKDLGLVLSILFMENGVQQEEYINLKDPALVDTFVDDNDNLAFYDKFDNRWIFINIAKIVYIVIHEKVIF